MILVTGGAGFIGSNVVAALERRGAHGIAVCDRLGSGDKWRNIAKRELAELFELDEIDCFLARGEVSDPGPDVAEVWSPPRVTAQAPKRGLAPGPRSTS